MAHSLDMRRQKLVEVLAKLRRGEAVQNRTMETWLGAEAYAEYVKVWQQQQELRAELKAKPTEVRDYEKRLKRAQLAYNKAEATSHKGKATAKELHDKAEAEFEGALERLQEIVHADPSLQVWFDRALDFEAGSALGPSPGAMPCVVTSRSLDNAGGGILGLKRTKKQVKIDAVEAALRDLEEQANRTDDDERAGRARLNNLLAKMSRG